MTPAALAYALLARSDLPALPAKPFGRRRGPLYESVPLVEAQDTLAALNQPSLAAILQQRFAR